MNAASYFETKFGKSSLSALTICKSDVKGLIIFNNHGRTATQANFHLKMA